MSKDKHDKLKSLRQTKLPDKWTKLEAAVQYAQKQVEHNEQHGPVKILYKDGKPV
jgi:hypothetical protein